MGFLHRLRILDRSDYHPEKPLTILGFSHWVTHQALLTVAGKHTCADESYSRPVARVGNQTRRALPHASYGPV